ncbi:hypothetical protein [Propionivibrio limicola]|nr:hypothetical protein [Propionivibrio limicola]
MTTAVVSNPSPIAFQLNSDMADIEERITSFLLVLFWLVISYFLIAF